MLKNVDVLPADEVELGANGQEIKAFFGQTISAFALEHGIKFVFEGVQMQNIVGGVLELVGSQRVRAPVRALLLFVELDAQKFAAAVAQTMAICVCTCEA